MYNLNSKIMRNLTGKLLILGLQFPFQFSFPAFDYLFIMLKTANININSSIQFHNLSIESISSILQANTNLKRH